MLHCLSVAKGRDKDKSPAFVCAGLLTIACKPATLNFIPKILDTIKSTLPTKVLHRMFGAFKQV